VQTPWNSFCLLCVSYQGQKHDKANFNAIDVYDTVLGRYKFEIDRMGQRPNLPRPLARYQQVSLNLCKNHGQGVTISQSKVGKVGDHKDGAPKDLINDNFQDNLLWAVSNHQLIQTIVEKVSHGSMEEESKGSQNQRSMNIKGPSFNNRLSL
jgi:hypothetical protein